MNCIYAKENGFFVDVTYLESVFRASYRFLCNQATPSDLVFTKLLFLGCLPDHNIFFGRPT